MKERSIFSYFWFWLLIIGIVLILLAAILHLAFKENTHWVWWIFAAGALLAVLGIIFAAVSYFQEPKCVPGEIVESECPKVWDASPRSASSLAQSYIPVSETQVSMKSPKSPIYSPIGTPTQANLNLPQAQRGFTTTGNELSTLAPPVSS